MSPLRHAEKQSKAQVTDLGFARSDRRTDERHAAEMEPDPLDDLRRAVRRSAGKELALDQVDQPRVSTLDQLRREREALRRRLGDGPPDPSWEYGRLSEEYARGQHYREGAQWRLDTARTSLDDLGPIGRRTHRSQRRELERRISGFGDDVARHEAKLELLRRDLQLLEPSVSARDAWERTNQPDLDRLESLDRQIDMSERMERLMTRDLERSLDRGLDRGLGLEL